MELKITKKQAEVIENTLYPLYVKLCEGDAEALQLFRESVQENARHIVPTPGLDNFPIILPYYRSLSIEELFLVPKAYEKNRKVFLKKTVELRGSKCFSYDSTYNTLPVCYHKGTLTMGTFHMHRFMYFLILMGFFNYMEFEPCVPAYVMMIISDKVRDSEEEMASYVMSFDSSESAYKKAEIIYTNHVAGATQAWIKENEDHNVIAKITTTAKDLNMTVEEVFADKYLSNTLALLCRLGANNSYEYSVFPQAMGEMQKNGQMLANEKPKKAYVQQGHILGILKYVKSISEDYPIDVIMKTVEDMLTNYRALPATAKVIVSDMVRIYHSKDPIDEGVKKALRVNTNAKNKYEAVTKILMEAMFND